MHSPFRHSGDRQFTTCTHAIPSPATLTSTRHAKSSIKILLITYKASNGLAPSYLVELINLHQTSRCLRSNANRMTATAMKTLLENVTLRNFYYFAIIPIRSTCTMRAKYPGTEFMGTAFK